MRFPHEKERTERMARATHLTIGTADRIRLDARSTETEGTDEDGQDEIRQEVQVSITYALDAEDTDLTALAAEKAGEVQRAHEAAWNEIGVLGNGGTSCARRSDFEEDDDQPDDGRHGAGIPPGPPPSDPPVGAWHLPGDSRPSGESGTPTADVPPDAEPLTGPQRILIRSRAGKIGLSAYALERLLYQQFKVWRVERLTKVQAASLLDALDRDLKEKDAEQQLTKERNGIHGSLAITGAGRAD